MFRNIAFFLIVLAVLAAIIYNFFILNTQISKKSCLARIRLISEMSSYGSTSFKKGAEIKEGIYEYRCPAGGRYFYDQNGIIYCTIHGYAKEGG